MIDWKYLISKYGEVEAPHKFEEIALAYVRDVYPQYSWYPTKKSRDGNKDAQRKEVYWGTDDSFDVWEEAKFKTGKTLRRQDLDPTVLSGLIQGNVRLIIFVTNAKIPGELLDRAMLGARIRGTKVSCVLANQLESWLALHPDVYENYWGYDHKLAENSEPIAWIHRASFSDMVSTDFRAFDTRTRMLVGDVYLLTVSISSNVAADAKLELASDTPFVPVLHPNYDNPNNLNVETGLSTFAILLKAMYPFSGGVNLQFKIAGVLYSVVTSEIEIDARLQEDIAYSQQLEITDKIIDCIELTSTESTGNLISLFASSGMGKSFILKNIHHQFGLRRDMTIVGFESNPNSLTNYLLLCQIVLFLYYGNIFWARNDWTEEEREEKKYIALQNNAQELFDDATLSQLFDGCFDAGVAKDAIVSLEKKRGNRKLPVKTRESLVGKLLLIDDCHYLNNIQARFLYRLLGYLSGVHNNCIIVVTATKGCFREKQAEKDFFALTPNIFELDGLTPADMAETLGKHLGISSALLLGIAPKILSPSPLLTRELLHMLTVELGACQGDTFQVVKSYSSSKSRPQIVKNRFFGLEKQYYLLDIIYQFKKGIPAKLLVQSGAFENRPVQADLNLLVMRGLVQTNGEMLVPYHDYYIQSYRKLRGQKHNNRLTGRFLQYLLNNSKGTAALDTDHILSMLIACGKTYQSSYAAKVKECIRRYMEATQFGAALHYCAYYYTLVKDKNPECLVREDYKYIYHYAYCLVHCGDRNLANDLLTLIYRNADGSIPEKYSAGAELLNQRFWEINLDGTIEDSYLIQDGVNHMLISQRLSKEDRAKLEHAYSTCFNRRMVILLLQERYDEAQAVYAERLGILSKEYSGDELCSRSATLIMDYARGLSFLRPKVTKHLLSIALEYFQRWPEYHHRRILLCQIDLLVSECVNGDFSRLPKMEQYVSELKRGGFYSEYFKGLLKLHACRLTYLSGKMKKLPGDKSPVGAKHTRTAQDEIATAMLECGLQPSERDGYLLNSLTAYFSICAGQTEVAMSYLLDAAKYIEGAGKSYQQIIKHNIENISTISHIAWGTSAAELVPDVFLLDCRYW